MTIVLYQISLHTKIRLEHVPDIIFHCLLLRSIPNLFASMETTLEFATLSFSLSLDPQEMSSNIDIKRILPVKVSGASPNLLSKSLTLSQSCNVSNPGKDCPLEFSRLSIDSVKVSVALRRGNPCYSLFPCFIRFRVLMDPPKTQYRI